MARITQLVEGIRDIVAQPGSDQDELRQASIDAALIEIGYLSGEEVRLGGPAYAKADGLRVTGQQYAAGALRLSRDWRWKRLSGQLYAKVENLWDENYELVANRPMPGRHYRVGVNVEFE